jgi:hypothetical protein
MKLSHARRTRCATVCAQLACARTPKARRRHMFFWSQRKFLCANASQRRRLAFSLGRHKNTQRTRCVCAQTTRQTLRACCRARARHHPRRCALGLLCPLSHTRQPDVLVLKGGALLSRRTQPQCTRFGPVRTKNKHHDMPPPPLPQILTARSIDVYVFSQRCAHKMRAGQPGNTHTQTGESGAHTPAAVAQCRTNNFCSRKHNSSTQAPTAYIYSITTLLDHFILKLDCLKPRRVASLHCKSSTHAKKAAQTHITRSLRL